MRVRFQIGERAFCITRNNFYSFGEIENNFDDGMAKALIKGNIAEHFEDSFNDEEIRTLHKNFISTKEFEKKVDLFVIVKTKSSTNVKLSDGTKLLFELTPTKPEEWYYYNKSLCDFYIKYFYRCQFESFKGNFERKFKNYPHYNVLRKNELTRIMEILNTDNNEGILYWYKEGRDGEIPLDEKGIKYLFSKKIFQGVENYLQGKAIFEYVTYLNTLNIQSIKNMVKPGRTKLFPEYLLMDIDDRILLAEKLKCEFSTEIGKKIRLMLEVLKDRGLLLIANGDKMNIYETLKEYFDRNIGSYNSIFSRDPGTSKLEVLKRTAIEKRIDFILNDLK